MKAVSGKELGRLLELRGWTLSVSTAVITSMESRAVSSGYRFRLTAIAR